MIDIFNNKTSFLLNKPKHLWLLILFVIAVIIAIIIVSVKIKVFDSYQTKGYVECDKNCLVNVNIPSNINYEKIKINNKDIKFTEIKRELELDKDNLISYYQIKLNCNIPLQSNEIVNLTFYYNKQRIFTKIKNHMF